MHALCTAAFLAMVLTGTGLAGEIKPAPGESRSERSADLVVIGARVWTGAESPKADRPGSDQPRTDQAGTQPSAIAVVGKWIVAVGSEEAIQKWRRPDTKVIDAGGRRVIPGITDSHAHVVSGGFQLARLTLRDVPGRDEFIDAVRAAVGTREPGEWVLGGRWSVESWSRPLPPTRAWIDPVTGSAPVFLSRMDGHQALVNSAALRLAGIDASGPADPTGGEIERDPITREPTGILKESAMDLVSRLIPKPTPAQRYETLRRAMRHANALGITSVHDMADLADLSAYQRAHREGTLSIRATVYLQTDDWAAHEQQARAFPINDDMLRIAGFKGYMDGSLGSRTAYMREPYSDAAPTAPYPRGQLTELAADQAAFRAKVASMSKSGWQIAVHAIGDEANHLLMDAYESAGQDARPDAQHDDAGEERRGVDPARRGVEHTEQGVENARRGVERARDRVEHGIEYRRHRTEHAQHLLPADIARFARLNVVASMQPFHKADDGRYADQALGAARLKGSYAYRQLLDAGALLCFGSDWPVVTMNPFAGIDSAVNARTLAGDVWLPSHSLTLEEALRAYTASPPRAIDAEEHLGTIEPGKLADLLILKDDPFTIPPANLARVTVDQTILAGRVVYSRSE